MEDEVDEREEVEVDWATSIALFIAARVAEEDERREPGERWIL